jgi:hypothetical protein
MFLEVRVETVDQRRVDKQDARLNPNADTLVEVGLPPRLP